MIMAGCHPKFHYCPPLLLYLQRREGCSSPFRVVWFWLQFLSRMFTQVVRLCLINLQRIWSTTVLIVLALSRHICVRVFLPNFFPLYSPHQRSDGRSVFQQDSYSSHKHHFFQALLFILFIVLLLRFLVFSQQFQVVTVRSSSGLRPSTSVAPMFNSV